MPRWRIQGLCSDLRTLLQVDSVNEMETFVLAGERNGGNGKKKCRDEHRNNHGSPDGESCCKCCPYFCVANFDYQVVRLVVLTDHVMFNNIFNQLKWSVQNPNQALTISKNVVAVSSGCGLL